MSGYRATLGLIGILAACTTTPNDPFETEVFLDFSGCGSPPTWVAYRDGDGEWTRLQASSRIFRFPRPQGAFAVAMAREFFSVTQVLHATADELPDLDRAGYVGNICPDRISRGNRHRVEVALQGLRSETDWYAVTVDGQLAIGTNDGQPRASIEVHDVARPVADVLVAAWGSDGLQPRWAMIRDAVNDQQLPVELDLMGDESFRPTSVTIPITGSDLQSLGVLTGSSGIVDCERGTTMVPVPGLSASVSEARDQLTLLLVPSARLRATEKYVQTLVGFSELNGVSQGRWLQRYGIAPFSAIQLPEPFPPIAVTEIPGSYPRHRFQVTLPEGLRSISIFTRGEQGAVQLMATAGYLDGSAVDLELPDFSAVDGWTNAFVAPDATELMAQGFSHEASFFASRRCHDRSFVFYSAALVDPPVPATPSRVAELPGASTGSVGRGWAAGEIDWNEPR